MLDRVQPRGRRGRLLSALKILVKNCRSRPSTFRPTDTAGTFEGYVDAEPGIDTAPNYDPGHWQPLLDPITLLPILDPTPWVGGVRPFLMQSSSQFRTDGPNALTSAAYAEDFNEVKALGSVNSTIRTPEQTHIALWWQSAGGPALLWNGVARNLANDTQYDVDVGGSASCLRF